MLSKSVGKIRNDGHVLIHSGDGVMTCPISCSKLSLGIELQKLLSNLLQFCTLSYGSHLASISVLLERHRMRYDELTYFPRPSIRTTEIVVPE